MVGLGSRLWGDRSLLQTALAVRFDELAKESLGGWNGCAQREELRPGDVVLVQLPQCSGAISLFWRCMAAGAVFVPVDRSWPEYLIKSATAGISPRLVVGLVLPPPMRSLLSVARP